MPLLFDAHLDLAINAIQFDRDLTESLSDLNSKESAMNDHRCRGNAVVALPEMRRGNVAVCVATVLARCGRQSRPSGGFKRIDFDSMVPDLAYAVCRGQLGYYQLLEQKNSVKLIYTQSDLEQHWRCWQNTDKKDNLPVGIILSMEGADPIPIPETAEDWWSRGLRVVSLAHYGKSLYAGGTGTTDGLTKAGRKLLNRMNDIGYILDVSHLSEKAFFEALDSFSGPVLASHNNCRALVPGDRQFSDRQIQRLVERDAVIGVALDAWMLHPGWIHGSTTSNALTLNSVVNQIDHICNLAGSARNVAIGSDLDGGFGSEQTPGDVKSIADLQKIATLMAERRFADEWIDAVFSENWLRFFGKHLPL